MLFKPDSVFLTHLVLLARAYGWEGDYTEIRQFVIWCHEQGGVPAPMLAEMAPIPDNDSSDPTARKA